MKDPFVTDSGIDSPTRESLRNIEGCYNRNLFNGQSFAKSRRALQSGAEKISRTFKCVRNTFGNISQEYASVINLYNSLYSAVKKNIVRKHAYLRRNYGNTLGRSPTKLYSPFGIETPHSRDFRMTPYMPDTPEHGISPKRRKGITHSWHVLAKKRPRALFH